MCLLLTLPEGFVPETLEDCHCRMEIVIVLRAASRLILPLEISIERCFAELLHNAMQPEINELSEEHQ